MILLNFKIKKEQLFIARKNNCFSFLKKFILKWLELEESTIHKLMGGNQKHFGLRVNQQYTISVFFLVKKIKSLELIVHLHGKILDKHLKRFKVIAMYIFSMKLISRFVNQKIKTKIISSLMKTLLIH